MKTKFKSKLIKKTKEAKIFKRENLYVTKIKPQEYSQKKHCSKFVKIKLIKPKCHFMRKESIANKNI